MSPIGGNRPISAIRRLLKRSFVPVAYRRRLARYTYPCNTNNELDHYLSIGQSDPDPDSCIYELKSGGNIEPVDTRQDTNDYHDNEVMSVAAATSAGYDLNRCLATYLLSIGFPLASALQQNLINQVTDYLKTNMQKGRYDPRFMGRGPVNHVRGGLTDLVMPIA